MSADIGAHVVAPDDEECAAFDRCAACRIPVREAMPHEVAAGVPAGAWVTMVGANAECYAAARREYEADRAKLRRESLTWVHA